MHALLLVAGLALLIGAVSTALIVVGVAVVMGREMIRAMLWM